MILWEQQGGMMNNQRAKVSNYQQGAVSLFVVIFTALLFVAVSVGFTILMLSDQQRSTDNDLAQSALDSANAGTEDAKRVLAQLADCQERGQLATTNCAAIASAIAAQQCNTVSAAIGTQALDGAERKVQQSEGDKILQQAYTCVKITPDTESYVGKVRDEGDVRVIPLKATGAFDTVQVSWLSRDDIGSSTTPNFTMPTPPAGLTPAQQIDFSPLLSKDTWYAQNRGSVLRVGAFQYQPGNVNISTIDDNARTAFLYPSSTGTSLPIDLNIADVHKPITDTRLDAPVDGSYNHPLQVKCDSNITSGYLCTTVIKLPSGDPSLFSYLTLASLYRATSFEVKLYNATTAVKFKNVQPEIDVTGRANDVFRRLVSRVESADANEAPYPRAALGAGGDICKNFVVTDDPGDYVDYNSSKPHCLNLKTVQPN